MIDAEEIFDSAHETGYRFCSRMREQVGDLKLFSTFWDPCNENRLILTSQDGILKTIDVKSGKCCSYNVLFKLFTTSTRTLKTEELYKISGRDNSCTTTGTVMTRHFDKMVCIPGRPDEFIFLLGVSQTLYYSALPGAMPYPDEPFISGTSRADMGEYIFGTPIMEIDQHSSRVTSMAVSSSGQVLASGDEHGMIRLLLLRQLDMFNIRPNVKYKNNEPVDSIKHHSIPTLPKRGRAAFRAHIDGPVFALQWLNFAVGSNSNRSYVLCSGSVDKVVRIWHVNATSKGLSVSQLFHFDIQSAHILCLSSYYLDTTPLSPFEAAKTGGSILVSAGTNTGSVYVWNIPLNELFALIEADPICHPEKETMLTTVIGEHMESTDQAIGKYGVVEQDVLGKRKNKAKMATFEHALWIHSLLHTSSNPIYTLCMTTYAHPAGRYLILLSADICGTVHIHKSDDTEILTVRNTEPGVTGEASGDIHFQSSKRLGLMPKTVEATRASELLTLSMSQLDEPTNQTSAFKLIEHCPLSYYGENAYPHQVIAITNQYKDHGVKGLNTVFREFALYSRALFSTSVHMQQQSEEASRANLYQPSTTQKFMVNNDTVNPMEIVSPKRLAKKVTPKASEDARVLICLANCDVIEYTARDLFEDLSANVVHEKVTSGRSPVPQERGNNNNHVDLFTPQKEGSGEAAQKSAVKSAFTLSPAAARKSSMGSMFGDALPESEIELELPPPPPPPLTALPMTQVSAVGAAPTEVLGRRASFQTIRVDTESDDASSVEPAPQKMNLPRPINTTGATTHATTQVAKKPTAAPAPRGKLAISPVPADKTTVANSAASAANTLVNAATVGGNTNTPTPTSAVRSGSSKISPGGHQYLTSFTIEEKIDDKGDGRQSPKRSLQRVDSMMSATTYTSGTSYGTSQADSEEDWEGLQAQVDTAVNSVLQSELSVQNLQSVKSLYVKHEQLVDKRDAIAEKDVDDMTVTTTNSDRQYAATVMNKLMMQKHTKFVSASRQVMTELQHSVTQKEKAKKKLPKQVCVIVFVFSVVICCDDVFTSCSYTNTNTNTNTNIGGYYLASEKESVDSYQ